MDSHVDHEFFSLSDLAMQSTTTHVVCEDGQGSQERRSDLGEALQPPNARAAAALQCGCGNSSCRADVRAACWDGHIRCFFLATVEPMKGRF